MDLVEDMEVASLSPYIKTPQDIMEQAVLINAGMDENLSIQRTSDHHRGPEAIVTMSIMRLIHILDQELFETYHQVPMPTYSVTILGR